MTSLTFWFWDVKGPAPGKLLLSKLLSKGEVFERVSPCHVVSRILRIAFTFFNICASNEIVQCNGDHRRSKLVRLVRKAWPAWRFQSFCVLVLILQHLSWFSEAPLWTSAPPATNCVPIQHEGKSWKRTRAIWDLSWQSCLPKVRCQWLAQRRQKRPLRGWVLSSLFLV